MTVEQMQLLTERLKEIIAMEIRYLKKKRLKTFMKDVELAFNNDGHAVDLVSAAEEEMECLQKLITESRTAQV